MAVLSKNHYEPNQYLYATDLERIETRTVDDFNLMRRFLSNNARILKGFQVTGTPGRSVTTVQAASGVVLDPGFVFYDGSVLGTVSITGAWIPDSINYVNLDLLTTSDPNVTMYDVKNLAGEKVQVSATAGSIISHNCSVGGGFPGNIPLAIVVTDASNNIVSIQDVRPMLFTPAPDSAANTNEKFGTFPATVDDIRSVEEAFRLLATKAWQQGGEKWYTNGSDVHAMFVTGTWTTTGLGNVDLTWTNVAVLFDNSTGWYNTVTAGSANLNSDGDCLYVDIDRTQNAIAVAATGTLAALGLPDSTAHGPGDRIVLAWRSGGKNYVRGQAFAVGGSINTATNVSYGAVMLNVPQIGTQTRVAVVDDSGGATDKSVVAAGLTRGDLTSQGEGVGVLSIGNGANDESVLVGKPNSNIYVDRTAENSFDSNSDLKSSGTLARWKHDGVVVGQLPFDGLYTAAPDLVLRGHIGWGCGTITGTAATGFNLSTTFAGIPFETYINDGICVI